MTPPAPRPNRLRRFTSLYWKLAGTLLLLLAVLAIAYVFITTFTAEMYFQEANQRLNAMVAPHLASRIGTPVGGSFAVDSLKSLFHDVMMINPSVEVYLLDTTGTIIAYSAPAGAVKRRSVSLTPIEAFLEHGSSSFVMGDDPRGEDREKVFSAAPIREAGRTVGYVYAILGGEEYDSSFQMLLGSYILRVGFRTMGLTLVGAALFGLIAFGLITRNLRRTVSIVKRFQEGDQSARIPPSSSPELNELATAFNDMADAIVRQLEEIKAMDLLRRDLVANVSHDLRTPLVSIHGYVETILMKDKTLTDEQRLTYLRTVLQSTERLKNLVEELLELSKLEAKQTKPKLERFSIAELVQDVVQKHLLLAENRQVALNTVLPHDLPHVTADIGLIERVFQNLLDNAIKYTQPHGAITITLRRAPNGVDVNIADTGSGIPADELPRIFDRYRRGGKSGDDSQPGAGLGLAIVKKILDIHGVSITVSSREAEGTAFSFLLPAVAPPVHSVA